MGDLENAAALRALYANRDFAARSHVDPADHAFIAIHLLERSIAALAPRLQGEFLDVGCGQQPYRVYFQHIPQITACDIDGARGAVDFVCPAHAIPVPAHSFDAVLCTEVLEHVPDPLAVWTEFHRVLRPEGRLLLTTPMYWPSHEVPYDFYRYPEHGLIYLAQKAGFEIEALIPRGGMWALFGQVGMHVIGHYLPARMMRRCWNRSFLTIDRYRNNPSLTIGWTLLARRRPLPPASE